MKKITAQNINKFRMIREYDKFKRKHFIFFKLKDKQNANNVCGSYLKCSTLTSIEATTLKDKDKK